MTQTHKAEIAALKVQLEEFEKLLDKYITDNEVLAKSKVILHEINRISKKIIQLKSLDETGTN